MTQHQLSCLPITTFRSQLIGDIFEPSVANVSREAAAASTSGNMLRATRPLPVMRAALGCSRNKSSATTIIDRLPRLSDLVLIRHGESEGNVARQRSLAGDHSLFAGEFKHRHSSNWRLTDRGRRQAAAAGDWLRRNNLAHFDRYLVSEYLRAMETAGRMGLPGARWYAEMLIRERDWGAMDLMSEQERFIKMQDELKRRELNRFYYAPPGGESLAAVAQRADRLLGILNHECHDKRAIVVAHGEVIWAMRTRLERMSQDTFIELQESGRMVDQIHNGHILHYTRRDPVSGKMAPYFTHVRSVCPWNEKLSPKGWVKIDRPVYDNELLLATAERVPRMIISEEYLEKTYNGAKTLSEEDATPDVLSHGTSLNQASASTHSTTNVQTPLKEDERQTPLLIPGKPMLNLKKVVVVKKTSRFQHEAELYGNTGEALRKQMSMRGFVHDRLKASHEHHVEAVDEITSSFKERDIEVKVVAANQLTHEAVEGTDMIFSAGGDGTFLKTASFVNTPIPVAGLNTDPKRSEGNLCCYKVDNVTNRFSTALDRLLEGDFKWRLRQRIRVGMVNQDGYWYELPRYALNEVFIAESDASRPSHYNIGIDQHQRESHRSSGILMCTGTGSSAWYSSACQVYREQVANVLSAMDHTHTNETVTELTESINKQNVFPEDSRDMGYVVREPIINATFGDIRFRRGKARRVSMRSLGWDMKVNIDGIYSVPLDYGVQAVMKIVDEPKYVLRTVDFSPLPGSPPKKKIF
ncbi:NAD kinase 2 [Phytophthora citrophthora]|uniref:NAD kinase 2 n=1 Tax=Phytophthora citrophthora TaxID=4793 RepID=A0AAD9GV66_9STRA|nr:NAD kinase 2 [Phytophthora citrophthora]